MFILLKSVLILKQLAGSIKNTKMARSLSRFFSPDVAFPLLCPKHNSIALVFQNCQRHVDMSDEEEKVFIILTSFFDSINDSFIRVQFIL